MRITFALVQEIARKNKINIQRDRKEIELWYKDDVVSVCYSVGEAYQELHDLIKERDVYSKREAIR